MSKDSKSDPVVLEEEVLTSVVGGARVPSFTPEFSNPNVGDPGATLRVRRMDASRGVWKAPAGVDAD